MNNIKSIILFSQTKSFDILTWLRKSKLDSLSFFISRFIFYSFAPNMGLEF